VELRHCMGFGMSVLLLEPLVESRDGLLHILDELRLILGDSAADFGPDEESIELGEHPEHLVCVLSRC